MINRCLFAVRFVKMSQVYYVWAINIVDAAQKAEHWAIGAGVVTKSITSTGITESRMMSEPNIAVAKPIT